MGILSLQAIVLCTTCCPNERLIDAVTSEPIPMTDPQGHFKHMKPSVKNDVPTGHRIRAARRRLGLTLQRVAESAQMDKGFLSRIERNEKTASIATIQSIAQALGMTVGSLLGEVHDPHEIHIVRADERKMLAGPDDPTGHAYAALTLREQGKPFSVFVVTVGTNAESVVGAHPGQELLFVLSGSVNISFAGQVVRLQPGDSVSFPGYVQHVVGRVGRRPAQVLIVVGGV